MLHTLHEQLRGTAVHLSTRPPVTVEHPAGVKKDVAAPPKNALMIALRKLENTKWECSRRYARYYAKTSRCNPVEKHMPKTYISCSSSVLNPRLQVATVGCQMAQELFRTMQCAVRPEFYEISLLFFEELVTETSV
jgi:hypothetical protein